MSNYLINKEIAKKIVSARNARGIKKGDMADKIAEILKSGYTSRQYYKIENGEFPKYKQEVAKAIEEILGLPIINKLYHGQIEQNVPHETIKVNESTVKHGKALPVGDVNITIADYIDLLQEKDRMATRHTAILHRLIEKKLLDVNSDDPLETSEGGLSKENVRDRFLEDPSDNTIRELSFSGKGGKKPSRRNSDKDV